MWYNEELQARAEHQVIFPDGLIITAADANGSPIRGWDWHDIPPEWWPMTVIYTETPFNTWTSASGLISPVNPKGEGWWFPMNEGWEMELTDRGMEWEHIEITLDSQGGWASIKASATGLWNTVKGWFS
jgi:hypothetical protein